MEVEAKSGYLPFMRGLLSSEGRIIECVRCENILNIPSKKGMFFYFIRINLTSNIFIVKFYEREF